MATIVRCNCGAEYKRTETKFLVPHTGDATCKVCGVALESWWNSTHVLRDGARGLMHRIPIEHKKRLIELGYIEELLGGLQLTSDGRARIAAGKWSPTHSK